MGTKAESAPAAINGAGSGQTFLAGSADRKIEDYFTLTTNKIGSGSFAVVYEGFSIKTGEKVAVKVISKDVVGKKNLPRLLREVDVMKKLKHQNIIQLHDVFENPKKVYIVLEYADKGELFDELVKRGSYSEKDTIDIIRDILRGVAYMHENGITHRDLKPENLLLANNTVKISDFGLSKDSEGNKMNTFCGSMGYAAPEILLAAPYDKSVDIWSIGVITYALLSGFMPWSQKPHERFLQITRAQIDFSHENWQLISDDAKDFIRKLLTAKAANRPTAAEILKHPWLNKTVASEASALPSAGNLLATKSNVPLGAPGGPTGTPPGTPTVPPANATAAPTTTPAPQATPTPAHAPAPTAATPTAAPAATPTPAPTATPTPAQPAAAQPGAANPAFHITQELAHAVEGIVRYFRDTYPAFKSEWDGQQQAQREKSVKALVNFLLPLSMKAAAIANANAARANTANGAPQPK